MITANEIVERGVRCPKESGDSVLTLCTHIMWNDDIKEYELSVGFSGSGLVFRSKDPTILLVRLTEVSKIINDARKKKK